MSEHLEQLVESLVDKEKEVVREALENVIPPWCEGIQGSFWATPVGQRLAESLWYVNHDEIVAVSRARKMIINCFSFDPDDPTFMDPFAIRELIRTRLRRYAYPARFSGTKKKYCLSSEVQALIDQIQEKLARKTMVVNWLAANPQHWNGDMKTVHALYQKETGGTSTYDSFRQLKRRYIERQQKKASTNGA